MRRLLDYRAIKLNRETKGAAFFGADIIDCGVDWFAVYTKPRQEHVALQNLEAQSFGCYLPLTELHGPRKRQRHEPLFPRYVFLNAVPHFQSLASVRSTRGVVGLVRAGLDLIKIPASIIAGLKSRMNPATGLINLEPQRLKTGDKVQVFSGPFAALEGVFKEYRGTTRSLLLLDILGRETAVEVEARSLRLAN